MKKNEYVKCDYCDGSGYVKSIIGGDIIKCPECNGYGVIRITFLSKEK